MQLDVDMEKRIRARAEKEGADPDEAVAEAKRLMTEDSGEGESFARPPVERLAPFFPFIRVRELRECWFGLDEAIPDDELSCSAFLEKYPPSSRPAPASPPSEGDRTANDSGSGQRQQKKLTDGSSSAKDATATPA